MIGRLRHTVRLCLKPHHWLIYVVSIVSAVAIGVASLDVTPEISRVWVIGYAEVYGSIAIALGISHVLTVDREEGFVELLRTFPGKIRWLALERVASGLLIGGVPMVVTTWSLATFVGANVSPILVDSAASWLMVSGIAALFSVMAQNWMLGTLAAGLYWIVDLLSRGRLGAFSLFLGTFPVASNSIDINRQVLIVGGGSLLFGAVMIFGQGGERFQRHD